MGTRIHDVLEAIVNGEADAAQLLPALDDELENLRVLNLDFPKDFKGGTAIRDNWIADMKHFCLNFVAPKGKFITEELILFELDEDHYFHGYVDLIKTNSDGSISIFDWKTSTNFTAHDLIHHGRQLVAYALAKQKQGFTVKHVGWIMLKYVEVVYMGRARKNSKADTEIRKVVNRGKLISELRSEIEAKLFRAGMDELEIECLVAEARKANSLDPLPPEVRRQFSIRPYLRYYDLTPEIMDETISHIWRMIGEFEGRSENESDWRPRAFTNESGKEDTFYCNVLCNFRHSCPHIARHNDLRSLIGKSDDELF